ncbi:MAG: PQQ-binding-like beta-propeller repeat protein, partial [Mariniblastus sp.]
MSLKTQFRFGLLTAIAFVSVCQFYIGTSMADDWPRWMGPTNDGVFHETGILDKFPENGPNVLWRQEIGAGYAGPAIAAGKVFVMDRTADAGKGAAIENDFKKAGKLAGGERVQCLDLKTGETVWEHTYNCPYEIAYPTGPRCTPTVDGEHVYVLGAMGDLKCMTTAKGEIVWEKSLTGEYKTKPPLWGYA